MATATLKERPEASPAVQRPDLAYLTRPANPDRLAAIKQHAGTRILDAGCGNGTYVNLLADQYDIHGMDLSRYDSWDAHPQRFSVGDVADLDYPENSFETVLSFEVLEHVADPQHALQMFHRIASRNVILTVPNCVLTPGLESSRLTFYHYTDRTHVNFFTLDSICGLCESVGLNVQERRLINPVNLSPLLAETYAIPRIAIRAIQRFLRRQSHYMTCLVVAKTNS